MRTVRIAIVEDEASARERIRECLEYVETDSDVRFTISEFSSGIAFLDSYKAEFDIVFMDIQMPGMTGVDCAHTLREKDPSVILIFVTNMAQFAISGYEVDALDFILKPINKYSFAMKVRRALARVNTQSDEANIVIRTRDSSVVVPGRDLYYVDVKDHDVVYHSARGDFRAYGSLRDAENELTGKGFVRISAWALVNLQYVEEIYPEEVIVAGARLRVTRNRKKDFLDAFSLFLGRRS